MVVALSFWRFPDMATKDLYRKGYTQHKSNAKQRGIEMRLTFEEWKDIWIASGHWERRGRGAEKYCMCRIEDEGHYEVGNVFIAQNKLNVSDGNIGKVDSEITRAKKSIANKGKPHPWSEGENNPMHRPEVKAKLSKAISGANHYNQRGIYTPEGYFVTAKAAAIQLKMNKSTVEWRARHKKLGFYYGEVA
jgi:hypothetical protein